MAKSRAGQVREYLEKLVVERSPDEDGFIDVTSEEITEVFNWGVKTASHCLSSLKNQGVILVRMRKAGQANRYTGFCFIGAHNEKSTRFGRPSTGLLKDRPSKRARREVNQKPKIPKVIYLQRYRRAIEDQTNAPDPKSPFLLEQNRMATEGLTLLTALEEALVELDRLHERYLNSKQQVDSLQARVRSLEAVLQRQTRVFAEAQQALAIDSTD